MAACSQLISPETSNWSVSTPNHHLHRSIFREGVEQLNMRPPFTGSMDAD